MTSTPAPAQQPRTSSRSLYFTHPSVRVPPLQSCTPLCVVMPQLPLHVYVEVLHVTGINNSGLLQRRPAGDSKTGQALRCCS